jgi:soluble lytic murein transglycosylase
MLVPAAPAPRAQQGGLSGEASDLSSGTGVLAPTAHPDVPHELSQIWLAPEGGANPGRSDSAVATAAKLIADGEYSRALTLVGSPAAQKGLVGQYAAYYAAVAQLRLNRQADALKAFRALGEQKPVGYLSEAAMLGEAEAQEALNNPSDAVKIYERLLKGRPSSVEDVYMRLGRAAKAARDTTKAAEAFAHVFYEFPLGENAAIAGAELNTLTGLQPLTAGSQRYKVELGRAERLFGAKQYVDARTAFEALRPVATGDDRERIQLRIAECDYFTKRARQAREALRTLADNASRKGEALFFFAMASRELGDTQSFLSTLERIKNEFPDQTWAEDALNNLATYYIKTDADDRAEATFIELYDRYPRGTYGERAAWKVGWAAYRRNDFADTAQVFERAASDFPRSDYRPAWLYWAGRAHEQLHETATAQQRYSLAAADYANSYYGRLALKRLGPGAVARAVAIRTVADDAPAPTVAPPNAAMIRALLAAGLYDDGMTELRFAQRMWGDSPLLEATMAWTRQQQARSESGMRRLLLLRGAINTMRRAYPQFMAAGGEELPREVLSVIFPIAYWDTIRRYASANDLDPYLVAALVAQESTFVADVKSAANAYGLMQLLPSTARQYARKLNVRYSTRVLTDPDVNIRLGTAYLADKIRQFGDLHLVLASYNAGEGAVRRWKNERPGLEPDEFVDDIPYPETQNYVKKILGTAEDYRRLYAGVSNIEGVETAKPAASSSVAPKKPAAGSRKPCAAPKKAPRKAAPARGTRRGRR